MINMRIQVTDSIRELLTTAAESQFLPSVLKHDASTYLAEESVPFSVVKSLCTELRSAYADNGNGPWVHKVCSGSRIILQSPPERKRSPELEKRLERLRREEDERLYRAMVSNVAKHDFEDNSFNLLPTFRLQLSFGASVLLTMFVFYLIGSYASRIFTDRPVVQALGGVVGLTLGLILETALFIIRSITVSKRKSD